MADIQINIKVVEGQAKAALKGLQTQTQATEKAFSGLNLQIKQSSVAFGVFLGNLASRAFTSAIAGIKGLAVSSIELAGNLETTATQFEVLTGSAGAANKILKQLQDFSASTPFQFNEIADAGKKLLSFGFELDSVQSKLQVLGDVSAASGANINEISLIFGQVAAAGKLTGERLLQLQERAIPIGPAIAKTMGIAESAVRDAVTKGRVDFATFEKAFNSLNQTGEFAFEGMIKRSQTLEGRISTLKDNFTILQQTLGAQLLPAFKTIVQIITNVIGSLTQASKGLDGTVSAGQTLIDTFVFFVQAGTAVVNTIQGIRFALFTVSSVIQSFVGIAIASFGSILEAATQVAAAFNIDLPGLDNAAQSIKNVGDAFKQSGNDALEASNDIAASIVSNNEAVNKLAQTTQSVYNEEIRLAKEAANAVVTGNEQKKISNQELDVAKTAEQQKQIQDEIKFRQDLQAVKDEAEIARLEAQLAADGELTAQDQIALEAFKFNLAQKELEQQASDQRRLGNIQQAQLLEQKIITDQAKFQADTQKRVNELNAKSRQQELQDQQAFFSAAVSLSNSENKTLLAIGRAAALAQLAIKTPEAIASSFAFGTRIGGPPLGFAFGAIAAAAMAAQAAQIVGLKFADGGIVPGNSFSGDRVSAQLNSGEMVLNKAQQSNLFNLANNGGTGSGQIIEIHNVIELDGEVVGRSVSRQVANGLKLGEVV